MSDKFIHHNRWCALHADDNGERGCYDVIEDDHGIYVHAIDGTSIRCATVAEADEKAQELADAYDKANPKEYFVSCKASFDVTVKAASPQEAERIIRERFHHTLSADELQSHRLGGEGDVVICGVKTYEYEVEESI